MNNKHNYFSIANKLFWILILLISLFALLKLNPGIFKDNDIAREIFIQDSLSKISEIDTIVKIDTTKNEDYLSQKWEWKSFDNKKYILNFKVKKSDYQTSIRNREKSIYNSDFLYMEMYNNDNIYLKDMINGYKQLIKENQLDYYEALNMIATSIQSISYTWVMLGNDCGVLSFKDFGIIPPENCRVSKSPFGCCNNVIPFAVYSPLEFAVQRTGDCDTRSLFAFTILKKLGYDVAVMVSESVTHSVLGVKVDNIPSDGRRGNVGSANNYYLWELTSYGCQLGQRMEGNDWRIALN